VTDAATGRKVAVRDGVLVLDPYPCQLRAFHVR
jgi:hypothetical protein